MMKAGPHGRPLSLDLEVSRQPGSGQAAVERVQGWASFDDGGTCYRSA
jgi:hypothetical protein